MEKPQNYPQDPKFVWQRFFEITQTPRPSKKEEKIRQYLLNLAKEKKLDAKTDKVGNVYIYIPASKGYENRDTVILQNHMDMVCDATPERKIDFETDPIETYVDGDWLKARETTLGSDNGMGMALALAIIDDPSIKHPPLELFFTVDEETGLHGALHFEPEYLTGSKLINIDTEDWGMIFIGCAGGIDGHFSKKYNLENARTNLAQYTLSIKGFKGGHSGVDIHQQRGNAIKFLNSILHRGRKLDFQIMTIKGGKAHNIIPRDVECQLGIIESNLPEWKKITEEVTKEWKSFLPENDKSFEIFWAPNKNPQAKGLSQKDQNDVISLLSLMPHGAHRYELHSKDKLVSSSNNLAQFRIDQNGELFLETSVRFFEKNESREILNKLESLESTFGLKLEIGLGYPSWRPEFKNNPLLELAKSVYKENFGEEPEVKAIHAGLECGIIKDKLTKIEAISIGPTIQSPHSPSERILIPTVKQTYDYLKGILEKI